MLRIFENGFPFHGVSQRLDAQYEPLQLSSSRMLNYLAVGTRCSQHTEMFLYGQILKRDRLKLKQTSKRMHSKANLWNERMWQKECLVLQLRPEGAMPLRDAARQSVTHIFREGARPVWRRHCLSRSQLNYITALLGNY